ncbi:uncharacterized protein LOC118469219 [Amphiprion ocellaris]|uniref:uncharacterized protein LOC118469219 n=1 Tax=Amphiprion ocellaris TaxID=80972 RepID=UPI0016498ECB|nr:uncharacterized protein LOC118469219 [Amphiprion ocellaris]
MQCANLLKKRSLDPQESWSCSPKRMCLEAELQVSQCPMETSHSFPVANQHLGQQVVQPRPALLCCPRCLGGEPGHINHIMGH